MQNFVVHSNESTCRKIGHLGMEQVRCYLSVMSQFPSQIPPTLPFPNSPLPPYLHSHSFPFPPPFPYPYPSMSPLPSLSPFHRYLSQGRATPTIPFSPALLYVAPLPDRAPVSAEWQYTRQRYSGGVGRTSPPTPTPLLSLPRPVVGRPTCP